jgi:hypothetical protein
MRQGAGDDTLWMQASLAPIPQWSMLTTPFGTLLNTHTALLESGFSHQARTIPISIIGLYSRLWVTGWIQSNHSRHRSLLTKPLRESKVR